MITSEYFWLSEMHPQPRNPARPPSVSLRSALIALALIAGLGLADSALAQSLRPSRASLDKQNRQARAHDFTYLQTASQVQRFVNAGLLVEVPRNGPDWILHDVSFPYARPEAKLFIERLASQFRAACGEKLVVTSLTRPRSRQPWNASSRSIHPTGMGIDLRRHYPKAACGSWLNRVLVDLEASDVLEVSVERNPPHYHMALFPEPYAAYVARITDGGAATATASATTYRVRPQDTLWRIAQRHGTTPTAIQRSNGLSSTTIHPGQLLEIPAGSR